MHVVPLTTKQPVSEILALAVEEEDILIIGKRNGQLNLWTSAISEEEMNWWLDVVKHALLRPYITEDVE